MDRFAFEKLCGMLKTVRKLSDTRNINVDEQVAIFLQILAHHMKNRVINFHFIRFGETISRHFHRVLNVVIRLHKELHKKPQPIPENSNDDRWKWFKNCLGALDGTYIDVIVPEIDKPRYRTRKQIIAVNVLGVRASDMQFIYVLSDWEGSATDSCVLHDALTRRDGLVIPNGQYYLVDCGYTNGEGFLAPYRGQRYHLNTWRHGYQPTTSKEFFNMKHGSARNVIERCFGLLKCRWAILRSPTFYPIKVQNKVILACCLLHNHIRKEMERDPMENEVLEELVEDTSDDEDVDPITTVEASDEWNTWRDNLANEMFNARF